MATLLIVEDHENLRRSLKECFEQEGYRTEVADCLKTAREKAAIRPDLVILDWMLPDGQGLDFLTELRKTHPRLPVIFLTARTELVDKVLGLELGASDYLTKPFEVRELLARVRVRLRELGAESALETPTVLRVGPLSIDRERHQVSYRDKAVTLVKKEFDLLALLAETPEKVFSRDEILNKVWGYEVFPTTRTVDTHVLQLRQKTEDALIETVRAVGYRLRVL